MGGGVLRQFELALDPVDLAREAYQPIAGGALLVQTDVCPGVGIDEETGLAVAAEDIVAEFA